ncbi:Gfo/Idh/MocA family protein [Enterococcus sp. 5H]|uniref:Gfo/Idh/MocA family protein n=1 Tax=Enterococcus sp. 5H TaxID=1229490 RepID=UPI002304CC5F|nr:Gfo/Idh/MocA family oxidoreductase [Enterococcus sp. 5H]MDA9471722.1 aerobic energy metabolism [Enterococcus sp. 5H]
MNKIRYGIISTAQIVPRFVEGVNQSRYGEVTAIASRTINKAEELAETLGIAKAYGNYQDLCQDEEIDIVYVATYNKGHYAAAKMALQHNKHVLVEKPFTLQSDQARELFELAEARGCFLMEAQKAVFLPISLQIKKAIQQNKIGKVRWLESITAYPSVEHISWFYSIEAGGGALHGSGSYPIQYMQFLLDQPIIDFNGTMTRTKASTDEQCNVALQFENQVLGTIFISVKLDIPSKMIIYGEKGRIEIPYFWKAQQATLYNEQGQKEELVAEFASEFVFEVDHVNECIQRGLVESPVMTKRLTLSTVQLVEQMYAQ